MATINIDFPQIVQDSIAAAKTELGNSFKKLKPFAEHEFTQFAENAAFLAQLKLDGTIDDEELKARLNIQRLALNNDLLAIEGIGLVTAQNIVNAVLDIVSAAVKKAIQVVLPV
jgi:hypothetical protein